MAKGVGVRNVPRFERYHSKRPLVSHKNEILLKPRYYLAESRNYAAQFLSERLGHDVVRCTFPGAGYLLWIDADKMKTPANTSPALHLANTHRLGLSDGNDFDSPRFVRMNYGCPRKVLRDGLERFVEAFEK